MPITEHLLAAVPALLPLTTISKNSGTANVMTSGLEKHRGLAVGLWYCLYETAQTMPLGCPNPWLVVEGKISARAPFLVLILTHSQRKTVHFSS